jgi:hypothetical protein
LSFEEPLLEFKNQEVYDFVDRTLPRLSCKPRNYALGSTICSADTANRRDGSSLESLVAVAGIQKFLQALVAMKPAKPIRKIADKFLEARELLPHSQSETLIVNSLMCVHLRTEKDWLDFAQSPPNYYSNEMYASKIKQHIIDFPQHYAGIKTVYITGDHSSAEFKDVIIPLFQPILGDSVKIAGHDDLIPYGFTSMENIQRASLDQHICAKAKLFVGNRNSGWSEMTTYLHTGLERPGIKQDEMLWFQVNDNNDDQFQQNAKMNVMHPPNEGLIYG